MCVMLVLLMNMHELCVGGRAVCSRGLNRRKRKKNIFHEAEREEEEVEDVSF